jgi:hypothetical protein
LWKASPPNFGVRSLDFCRFDFLNQFRTLCFDFDSEFDLGSEFGFEGSCKDTSWFLRLKFCCSTRDCISDCLNCCTRIGHNWNSGGLSNPPKFQKFRTSKDNCSGNSLRFDSVFSSTIHKLQGCCCLCKETIQNICSWHCKEICSRLAVVRNFWNTPYP